MRPPGNLKYRDKRGFFVAIEGIDGAGKTTIARLVADKLKDKGLAVTLTKEPYDECITRHLERVTMNGRDPFTEALLFAADRMIHYKTLIRPSLESGEIVITDRYKLSSISYQSARGAPRAWVEELNRYAPEPDMTIVLDLPVEEAVKRLKAKKRKRLAGLESLETLEKIREIYLAIAEDRGYMVIDARMPPEDIAKKIVDAILREKSGRS